MGKEHPTIEKSRGKAKEKEKKLTCVWRSRKHSTPSEIVS